jgi:hypothetical protein
MTVPSLIESLRRGPTDVSFSRSRRTELGVVDYLPYQELVEPDVMLTTYGALGSIFEVQFEDTSVLSDEDALRHEAWTEIVNGYEARAV